MAMKRVVMFMVASLLTASYMRAQTSVSEQYLFQAANQERLERGLQPLRWDDSLYLAAHAHAYEMAARRSISHQYPGEAELGTRAQSAGARFSVVAENVAEAPESRTIHDMWMKSPGHRANLLDARVNAVAISVIERDGELYAVQDFDKNVQQMSFNDQENAVGQLLSATVPLRLDLAAMHARQTCTMDSGFAGERRPWFIMRFTSAELNRLPDELVTRLQSGKFHEAAVGACQMPSGKSEPFSAYNIAVLLYP